MNDSNNLTSPKPPPERVKILKETTNALVPISRALSEEIKEELKKLKADTHANYSQSDFLALLIEDHWRTGMDHLRKHHEKLRKHKG